MKASLQLFYTDLKTGEIMEEWHNPYMYEMVKVVPIANDPFNELITAYNPPPPSYGGRNTEKREKIPMLLDWERRGNDLNLSRRINLFYPSALQPDKWPRESPGKFNQVREMFLYKFNWEDMQHTALTAVKARGVWNRVTPWLPCLRLLIPLVSSAKTATSVTGPWPRRRTSTVKPVRRSLSRLPPVIVSTVSAMTLNFAARARSKRASLRPRSLWK